MSLAFGVIAQLVAGKRATRWLWLVGAAARFTGGLIASEVVFGTATEEELQPIIDGLCLDEAAPGGLLVGLPVVLATSFLTRRSRVAPRANADTAPDGQWLAADTLSRG
jgi:hypothetical protein